MTPTRGRLSRLHHLNLNLLLLSQEEVREDAGEVLAALPFEDPRSKHVANVLRLHDGDCLRAGVLSRGIDDAAKIRWIWPEGYAGGWEVAESPTNVQPTKRSLPGRATKQKVLPCGLEVILKKNLTSPYGRSRVDLMLALPRPLQLQRMLPMIAQLGVGTLVLTAAAKVEKDYFGSHLIRHPEQLKELLEEGLTQVPNTPHVQGGARGTCSYNLRSIFQHP